MGDAGPLLDMMAATLEKLPSEPFIARSTLQAVSVLALAVAHLPDHLYAHEVPHLCCLFQSPYAIKLKRV